TPYTSAAGSERVNVTQSQLFSARAAKALSSTSSTSGKWLSADSGGKAAQKRSASADLPGASNGGASTARTPGRQTRGSEKPSGSQKPSGSSAGRARRLLPAAATTSFEPALRPVPE